MCIQAIAKALTGDFGGAFKAEANAWGIGAAGANGAGARGSYFESRQAQSWGAGSSSHGGAYASGHGYGRTGASFEKTTTQTRVGADGSVTQKTTQISHSGAGSAGYGNYGYNAHTGYGQFGQSGSAQFMSSGAGARGFSHSFESSTLNPGAAYSASGASGASGAAGGSFAAASVSIGPAFGLGRILSSLFGLGASNASAG